MASLTKSPPPAVIVPSGRVPVGRNHSSVTFTSRGIIKTPPKKLHLLSEISWYNKVRKHEPNGLGKFMPIFYGPLDTTTISTLEKGVTNTAASDSTTESTKNNNDVTFFELEDVTRPYEEETLSVADFKLGQRTYEPTVSRKPNKRYKEKLLSLFNVDWDQISGGSSSPPSKYQYMNWRDRTTTSSSLGFRLTGMRVTHGGSVKEGEKAEVGGEMREMREMREG